MTVKELIEELQKIENKNLKVVVRGEDPTDYVYYNDIEISDVSVGNAFYDEGDDYRIRRRVIINGGMF